MTLTSHRLILPILLLAFFLRTYQLDNHSLRGDEAASVLYSAMPLSELGELSRVTDPHPPLYYATLHVWQILFGEAVWPMRFFGAVVSTVAVAVLYRLAQRTVYDVRLSLLSGLLLAVSPLQVWLAQDLRSYSLLTLMGLLSSWALWGLLVMGERLRLQVGWRPTRLGKLLMSYILLTTACLYIHYYAVFLIAFQGLFVLLNARRFWPIRGWWLISQLSIALLIIPGLTLAANFIGQAAGGIETIPTADIFRLASTALLTGFTIDQSWGLWLSLLLAPVWLFGLAWLLRLNWTAGTFWGLFFFVPVAGVIALSIDRPFFKERFLIQAQPAFCLLVSMGLLGWYDVTRLWLTKRFRADGLGHVALFAPVAGLLLLFFVNSLALSNYFFEPAYAKSKPWRFYHEHVRDHALSGDVMLTNFPEASVSYYSPNELPFYVVPEERDRSVDYRLERTAQVAQAYQRIWFLPLLHQGFDETGDVLHWLDQHADRVNQIFFPDYNLNLYLTPTSIEARMIPQPTRFLHGVRLRGFQIFDKAGNSRLQTGGSESTGVLIIKPKKTVTLSLYWQTERLVDQPYTVFVHLIAADGFNQTSQDNQPVWGTYPLPNWSEAEKVTDKYTLTMPEGIPTGDYRLRVGWYQSDTGERQAVIDEQNQPIDEWVILNGIIRVE
ncbi:glycosyltransferase family 39 protein [Anaerolineales bacterium HSG6]|nr:glycosyltransferase family 39 protein [Anaerolineales bacterium HSG6]